MKTIGKYIPANAETGQKEVIVRDWFRQGRIYKNRVAFEEEPDQVSYIPELSDKKYTKNDLLELVGGDRYMASALFDELDWQHPESLIEEYIVDGEWSKCGQCSKVFQVGVCPECGYPVPSRIPWYTEKWYEDDLLEAMRVAGVPATRVRLNKLRNNCRPLFNDKSARNEMLVEMASSLFGGEYDVNGGDHS